jgi:hypothetical protein
MPNGFDFDALRLWRGPFLLLIRTITALDEPERRGKRFPEDPCMPAETRYAANGPVNIAYQLG